MNSSPSKVNLMRVSGHFGRDYEHACPDVTGQWCAIARWLAGDYQPAERKKARPAWKFRGVDRRAIDRRNHKC